MLCNDSMIMYKIFYCRPIHALVWKRELLWQRNIRGKFRSINQVTCCTNTTCKILQAYKNQNILKKILGFDFYRLKNIQSTKVYSFFFPIDLNSREISFGMKNK